MTIEALPKILAAEANINVSDAFLSANLNQLESSRSVDNNPFLNAILSADNQIKYADGLVEKYISGENIPVHDMVIAMNKAKTEVQFLVEVRNKVFEAYQEISKLQI
ncbi:flagellar hook-basal body complex protein FliE [Cellvibrio zantedeschiae]|uniref:Flagellar hook-basal body complex protein FliE n=1 Tax=Cellvibrio zantedeschiae TaxID=1237077 RepID=A0ABQ3B972_9GAMM|nr:flagellar hook-basal body complex protein FliE [Cellvibrio zantedeschiae]GGY84941.1 flagellar hook-basal body complex protein FliE [Cellvibrio zantedeschiae]